MKFFKSFLYVFYIPLAALDIYFFSKNDQEEPILIFLSVFFFLIPFLSLFGKKKVHHILYRIGEFIFATSEYCIIEENDNYKQFDKMCFGILITAYIFLLLDISIQLLS